MGISPITAQLLINRGIYTVEQGRVFLGSELKRLHSPLLLKDIKKAAARILKAVEVGEKVLVYGDYDADGITATVLLVRVLRRIGAVVDYYIPSRLKEGYGIHLEVLRKAREKGTGLMVTVDCGISAQAEALWAEENGLDLIITDHHEPPAEIPAAFAIINPKRPECSYPFKELAGVGVALKLAQVLLEKAGVGSETWQEYLDLTCLGTIADIVPIHGENRILVKHGLPVLANTGNPGLQALMAVSGINKNELGPREVGFGLAPRLNAAGRIGSPDMAVKLLLTDNIAEAWELASALNKENQTRRKIESDVLEEALKLLEEEPELKNDKVLVLASENWHPGVIGIVASRLMDRFYCPVLLIALEGEKGRGSARSIPGFNIHKALTCCREYLLDYGGHALAAGFSIESCRIEDFRMEINKYAGLVIGDEKIAPYLELDGIIDMAQVSEGLINEINMLRPFGHRNPAPLLGCLKASVLESRCVGKRAAHLKLRLRKKSAVLDGIGFNLGSYAEVLATGEAVDLAFVPDINEYNGRRSVQLKVKELGIPATLDLMEQENRESSVLAEVLLNPSTELFKDKEELFTPEFVLNTLGNLNMNSPGKSTNKEQIQSIELIDRRGSIGRPSRLAELAGEGQPTLVITSCAYQTIELVYYLQTARPSLKRKVAFCHGFIPKDTRLKLTAKFEKGEIKTVVVTPAVAGYFGRHARRVLIYHLPFSRETINCAINVLQPGGRLYLLFGPEDLEENLAVLEALAPDRECLAGLYILLRRAQKDHRQISVNPGRVAYELSGAGFNCCRDYTVRVGLAVLEELELLKSYLEGELLRIHLLPAPKEKRDLMEAQTYKRLQLIKKESISWMRDALQVPINN